MKLRPHQERAIQMARESIKQGYKRPIIAAHTSFGKTVLAGQMLKNCADMGKRGWFFCDRINLVDQTIDKLNKMGVEFGVRQADHELRNPKALIQIASVQTVAAMVKKHNGRLPEFDFALVDECFTPGHEILTNKGWVKFEDIEDHLVAQYSHTNESIEFVKPKRVIKKQYCGDVYSFKSDRNIDIEVTANHEMLFSKNGAYRKCKAKDLVKAHYNKITCAPSHKGISKIDPMLALMIAYQADGSRHNENTITFQFSKQRKIDRLFDICDRLGLEIKETKSRPPSGNIREKRRFFIKEKLSKFFYKDIDISKLEPECCAAIVEEFAEWDGHRAKENAVYFSSTDEGVVDFYQAVSIIAGYKTNKTIQVDNRKESYKDIHRLFITKNLRCFSTSSIKKKSKKYSGYVYCVEVDSGNILVRRNGKPLMIGNCHTQYEILKQIIQQYNNIPIVGLTATPYSKGLGKLYNNLLVPSTPRESLERGDLCPIRYYAGEHIDLSKIRSNNANEFNPGDIERETNNNKELLTGCIIKNWLEWSGREQTIAFSPTQDHSKFLVDKFNSNGISAEHIDCYTPEDDRRAMFEAHNNGEFKILSCSRLLNTGYDAPSVRCIIDCFPTKSVTTYVQRIGRLQRTFQGKEYGVYLGHSGNFERFGYAEDIIPTELHDGEKPHREQDLIKKKEKKDAKVKDCPQCYQQMQGVRCMSCGYQVPMSEQLEDDGTMLQEIGNKVYRETGEEIAQRFYSDLVFHGNRKSMNNPVGWARHRFKEKFDCWPSFNYYAVDGFCDFTKKEFARENIARKHAEKKAKETMTKLQEMFNEEPTDSPEP